jgi:NAD(P)-dependent dehydrogenase (short-subunit alcohol dehydrogenase family)
MSPVVFISGAGRGLGLCLTDLFLKNGYTVLAGQYRVTEGLARLAAHSGGSLHCIPLDVIDDDSVAAAAAAANSLTAHLDVLINNAAICEDECGRIEQVDFESVAQIMNVNTLGPLRLSKTFLPLLRKGNLKTIVNISSEAGSIADCWRKGMFGYSMSKAALNMQTRLLSNYLGDDGFRVLSIHPGWMRTDMGGKNAEIEPVEAAEGIYSIVTSPAPNTDVLFYDYKGAPLKY